MVRTLSKDRLRERFRALGQRVRRDTNTHRDDAREPSKSAIATREFALRSFFERRRRERYTLEAVLAQECRRNVSVDEEGARMKSGNTSGLIRGKATRRAVAAVLGVTGAVVVGGWVGTARSADHLDAPAVKAEPAADIDDLYSWMDGNSLVLVMTVFPAATTAAKFSDKVQYVFHTSSGAAYGATTNDENVICTFDVAQTISCWAGTSAYVTGDASTKSGLSSADGKFKVFAGLRADPFFFNLDGFKHAVATVEGAAGSLTFDVAGCPELDDTTAATLRTQLQTNPDGGPPVDFFKSLNGLAIVVSIDKSLVTKGGPIVSAWVSTNRAP